MVFGPGYGHWKLLVSTVGAGAVSVSKEECSADGMAEEVLEAHAALVGGKVHSCLPLAYLWQ